MITSLDVSGIYQIVSPSGMRYIGSALRIRKRWNEHKRHFLRDDHHCTGLRNAARKYGRLEFSVLEMCAPEDLLVREQWHIDRVGIHNLYNSTPSAGSMRGFRMSMETRARMAIAATGRPKSAATQQKLREANAGKKASGKARQAMQRAQQAHWADPEKRAARREKQAATLSQRRTTSGFRGVTRRVSSGLWTAKAPFTKKCLGDFDTAEEAAQAIQWYLANPEEYVAPLQRNNKSGHVGISWNAAGSNWTCMGPRGKYLGRFKTIEEAVAARQAYLDGIV